MQFGAIRLVQNTPFRSDLRTMRKCGPLTLRNRAAGGQIMAAIKILEVAWHRNGCCGEPFYAVRFIDEGTKLLALVFDQPDRVVVIDPAKAAVSVAFGTNSWRGDIYEAALRQAIAKFEDACEIRSAMTDSAGVAADSLH